MLSYKEKLKTWNNTDKYRNELKFLCGLIGGGYNGHILDYGCGIGTAIKYLSIKTNHFIRGYDVVKYLDEEDETLYDNDLINKYDIIYFNHSIAHIPNIQDVLISLKGSLVPKGRIIVITPNWEWMDKGYNEDKTVIKHFDVNTLSNLFLSAGYKIDNIGQFGEVRKDIHQHNRLSNERVFLVASI